MTQLLVRKVDEDIMRLLKERAAVNGHSDEEEHRIILREALLTKGEEKETNKKMTLGEYLVSDPFDFDIPLPDRSAHPARKPFEF
jgi:plasmid stability protein